MGKRRKKWKGHSSNRRDQRGQNQSEWDRLGSGHRWGRSMTEIADRKQRLDYPTKEGGGDRIGRMEVVRKDHGGRTARGAHSKHDRPERGKDDWRRNLVQRQERSCWREKLHHIAPRLRKYHGRGEEVRRDGGDGVDKDDSLAARTEEKNCGARKSGKKTFDPVNFQKLILSKGLNKLKQVDTSRNVIWGEEVANVIEDDVFESLDGETIFEDYFFKEYSELPPSKRDVYSRSMDDSQGLRSVKRMVEEESDLETSEDVSMRTKVVNEVSRMRKFFRSSESQSNYSKQINDDEVFEDTLITDVYSEDKRDIQLKTSSKDAFTSDDSEDDPESVKTAKLSYLSSSFSSPHLDHDDLSSHKSLDSNISLQSAEHPFPSSDQSSPTNKVRTLHARFSGVKSENICENSQTVGKSSPSVPSFPSTRTAITVKSKQEFGEREAKKVCSKRLSKSKSEHNQRRGGLHRSSDPVLSSMPRRSGVEQCRTKSSNIETSVKHLHRGQTENATAEDEVIAITVVDDASKFKENKGTEVKMSHLDEPSDILAEEKIIVVDTESESEVGEEERYEEPSPEVFEHVDLRADTSYTPITRSMHNVVTSAMHNINEVVFSRHNIDITKHDLFTLTGDNWLNDKIVEMFLTMIAQRSASLNYISMQHPKIHSMSTYFFTNLSTRGYSSVKKWTKEVDIFSYDMVLVPIHMDKHWSLASIDFRVPGVFHYDSLGSTVSDYIILSALLHYLSEEHMDKRREEMNLSKFAKHAMNTPLQKNGSDCGVFCCKVGDFLSRDIQLRFCQADIKYFRKRMIFEILKGVLLEP